MVNQTRAFTNSYNFKKWVFDSSGFNQYGLYHDDVLYEDDDVKVLLVERFFSIESVSEVF